MKKTIRKKMILILLASTIIPLCFVGMLGYYHARYTLESLRIEELKSITDIKAKMIEDFFAEQKKHISVAQQRPTIKKIASILVEFEGDFSSPVYETIRGELDQAIRIYEPVYDFRNVILTNPAGRIVYVLDRSSAGIILGQTLPDLWVKSFLDDKDVIQFSDIFESKIETGRFSMFFSAPIHSDDGQFVGAAVFETDMAPIYELIQNTTGLGETGETLIAQKAGNQALFLNPLRHDPDAALKRRIDLGEWQDIAIQQALKGRPGWGISVDYRDRKVLAAWRYLPSLDWGMVAKIDLAEAFAPVTTLRDFVFVLLVIVIVLSIFTAFIVAKSFSDPIQALQQGAEEIGRGNLDFKVGTDAKDEIGQLGRAFDQMTEKLKAITASRDELNREINERKKAEETLRLMKFSLDHSSEMLYWIDPDGNIVDVNDTTCNRLGYSRDEIVSMRVDGIDPDITADEYHQIWQDLKRRGSSKMQSFYHTKDGSRIPVEITLNYIQFGGRKYNCTIARDITERKQAEEELQKSMSELEDRVKELNCLFEISRLVEKRDLTLDEILQGIIDLIPPAWQHPDITCARINLNGKKLKTQNFKETIWQQACDVIIHGVPSGKLVVGYLEERPERNEGPFLKEERELLDAIAERVGRIIERKWAQEEVRRSEEKFHELMENMHSGVAVYEAVDGGQEFEIKDFNHRAEKIENINRDKVIGRRVTDIFPGVKNSGLFDVIQRVWKTGIPEHFSGGIYQDHRTPPSWRESYAYKLSSGEIVTVYQDVTEQKLAQKSLEESEKRFRDLVENSLTGISIVQDNQVLYQNKEQERLLGPLPRSCLLADFEKIHSEDVEMVKHLSQKIDRREIQTLETGFRFYPKGKRQNSEDMRWVNCRTLLTEYRGKEAILVNMIDMTKAKELEHLLTVQDKMASLGRVAAGMAHEIRNPLSGINIYLNTLKKLHHTDGSEEKVKQIIDQIHSASHKIESVIRRVMDFAKPGEPKLALIDLNRPVEEAINLCAVSMRKSGIALEKALSENLPSCNADPTLIEEMVLNLLNNAAEAMKTTEEGKKIVVSSFAKGDDIILTVSDSGLGIAPEIRDKIFDPYFTTKSDGTGIGLSICHRIVTDHNGSLTVSDSELGGAQFRVEIPIKR
ncbi:MAG: PAS domain S-box protein [Deltaproteobacteria bacterium]|jgi:PAS domain S-box-containing protein|nr:PAS domain S-box protein [Deltaproteobacteria bacterium]